MPSRQVRRHPEHRHAVSVSSATAHPSPLLDPFHPQGVCASIALRFQRGSLSCGYRIEF